MPNFFTTLFRRKLVIWFLISEVLRNYWLSAPYGRNWQYLWSGANVPVWAIVIEIAVFFIGVWGLIMGILIRESRLASLCDEKSKTDGIDVGYAKVHSWLLPVFAVGLGAPRWCQMWWGVSGMGLFIPWAGVAGPYM